MATAENLFYLFVLLVVVIMVVCGLFSLHQKSRECSRVDPHKELKNVGESACFVGKNGEIIEITYPLRRHYKAYFHHNGWLEFKLCRNSRKCRKIKLTTPQRVYIGKVRVLVPGLDDEYYTRHLYVYTPGDNKLKFKLESD
jgi:hypothetical protein